MKNAGWSKAVLLGWLLGSCSSPPPQRNPIQDYRRADFGDTRNWPALDDAYRNRIALEFEIIRSGRVEPLREALHDPNPFVQAFSVAALGILNDRPSIDAIAKLVEDPQTDRTVAGAALLALGWLKGGLEVVRSARTRSRPLSRHLIDLAERQIQDPVDHAATVRRAYQAGLRREEIGSARTGAPAPDFAATDTDGGTFRLGEALTHNKVVILVFVAADW